MNFDPVKDDTTYTQFTDSFRINVSYAPADSSNQLRDIKPLIAVKVDDYFWYYIVAAVLLAVLLVFIVIRLIKKRGNKKGQLFESTLTPYDEAMAELKKLDMVELDNPTAIKKYHSRLSEIFKRYYGRKQNLLLLNSTTGDLLIRLRGSDHAVENIADLAVALRCNDAVKFAKYLPLAAESRDALQKIIATIKIMEFANPNHKT